MNQPAFNTHQVTQIEAEHKAALEYAELDRMMTRENILSLLNITSQTLFLWIRNGEFPKPDFQHGNGPTSVRRWYPSTVFGWIKSKREQEAA